MQYACRWLWRVEALFLSRLLTLLSSQPVGVEGLEQPLRAPSQGRPDPTGRILGPQSLRGECVTILDPCRGHSMSCQPRPSPPVLLCTSLWPVMAGILTVAISIRLSTHGPEASKMAQTSGNNMNAWW